MLALITIFLTLIFSIIGLAMADMAESATFYVLFATTLIYSLIMMVVTLRRDE